MADQKNRFTLNYKGLPYKTEWVEYPDIERVSRERGGGPTGVHPDGRPRYSLPMIYDPNTNTTVSDSAQIAKYLDKAYPETPVLFPEGTHAMQTAILDVLFRDINLPVLLLIPCAYFRLSPASEEYVRKAQFAMFGKTERPGGEEEWKVPEDGFRKVQAWLSANGAGKDMLFAGDTICFADIQLAAILVWLKLVCGEGSEEWTRICGWHDGKWSAFLAQFEPYMQADN